MHFDILRRRGPKTHPPGKGGLCAEGLPVDEIGPAADALAQQQPHNAKVRHGSEFQLFDPGVNQRHQDAYNNGTVNGQAAVPDGNDTAPVQAAVGISEQVQIENHIVDAGAHNTAGHGPQNHIQHIVLRQAEALGLLHTKKQARQHADGQNDAVPVDTVSNVDGNRVRVEFPVAEQPREADGHIFQSGQNRFLPFSWGQAFLGTISLRTARSSRRFSRRKARMSSLVMESKT